MNFIKKLQNFLTLPELPEESAISSIEANKCSSEKIDNKIPEIMGEVKEMEKTVEQTRMEEQIKNEEIKPEIVASQQSAESLREENEKIKQEILASRRTAENLTEENEKIKQEILASQRTGENLTEELAEIKKLSREFYKHTSTIQDNNSAVKELNNNLQQTQRQLDELQTKYLEEILINKRQENGELKRELNEWVKTAIEFFSLLERAIECEKKENQRLIQKILSEFERTIKLRGLDRIIPQCNEPLAENFHEAIEVEESSDITSGNILRCASFGYRIGSNVIKKAKVIIAKPPEIETEEVAIKASQTPDLAEITPIS